MSDLLPGTEVVARGLRWELVQIEPLGQQSLYRLRGLEQSVLGRELDLLVPFEQVSPVLTDISPTRATPLSNWLVYHQAFLLEQKLGRSAFLAVQPGRLRIENYQLVPVLRALGMSRVRLLLCDDVGLGKTIQAGLIIAELMARRLAHRILIVSPAGPLLEQWRTELAERFGLRADVIDRAKLQEVSRAIELGANPLEHIAVGLASMDFLKQERLLETLERTSYDVIVLDEAHHYFRSSSPGDRDQTQLRKFAELAARRSDCLLLLTATPHDGYDNSFASLLDLLDPSLVDGRGVARRERYARHVIRRLKSHIRTADGSLRFLERTVVPIKVAASADACAPYFEMQRALLALIAPELRKAYRERRYSDVLSYISLLKRSVSTVAACRNTLAAVAATLDARIGDASEEQDRRKQAQMSLAELRRDVLKFGALSAEQEQDLQQLEIEDIADQLASIEKDIRRGARRLKRKATVKDALLELVALAESAIPGDPKIEQVYQEILAIRGKEPRANVLLYTEYADSQEAVVQALAGREGVGRIITISGQDPDAARMQKTELFRRQDNLLLVSTDASAEGLNLHQRCHHLTHLELPFNPNRLEQRNGRIDRYGQDQEPIVRYLYLARTFEERILLRLVAKCERQRRNLTFVPNTLGFTGRPDAMYEGLLKGLMDEDTAVFEAQEQAFDFENPDTSDPADPATEAMLSEIERCFQQFTRGARTSQWLFDNGLNAEADALEGAQQARERGAQLSPVELVPFVLDAVRADGGSVRHGEVIEVKLPPLWAVGLDELPGYDADTRTIYLTTDIDVSEDAHGHSVGYLGRAHPLVRRALDRTRNVSFGSSTRDEDRRASAVEADVERPQLLLTYLCHISSRAGREFEQLVAVRTDAAGYLEVIETPDGWLSLARRDRAISVRDVWANHFEDWGPDAQQAATRAAEAAFKPIADEFRRGHLSSLAAEESDQRQWAQQVADAITGQSEGRAAQRTLFEGNDLESAGTAWASLTDPAERLSAFAAARNVPHADRLRAQNACEVLRRRKEDLDARMTLEEPEVRPLGLLMIVPSKGAGDAA